MENHDHSTTETGAHFPARMRGFVEGMVPPADPAAAPSGAAAEHFPTEPVADEDRVIDRDQPGIVTTAASRIQARISECLSRAVKTYCDQREAAVVRDVIKAYLYNLCKERPRFLLAALQYLRNLDLALPVSGRYSLAELIIHPPARWEFEYLDVFGTVADALCCAGRYRTCAKFFAVHPVQPGDPLICELEAMRIPMRHKPTSPWFKSFMRRRQLKNELGSRGRSLVGYARTMTKAEFLEQFAAKPGDEIAMVDRKGRPYTIRRRIPDISRYTLLDRTGYSPEEFWREVKRPNTIAPHKPQLELLWRHPLQTNARQLAPSCLPFSDQTQIPLL